MIFPDGWYNKLIMKNAFSVWTSGLKFIQSLKLQMVLWAHSGWITNETQQITQFNVWLAITFNHSAPTISS